MFLRHKQRTTAADGPGMTRSIPVAAAGLLIAVALAAHAERAWPPASAESALDRGEARVAAHLLVHPDDAGHAAVRIGVLLALDPGWHVYWRNPGGSGLPTELALSVDQARVGPVQWPHPERFFEPEAQVTTFGYEDEVLLWVRATLEGDPGSPRRAHAEVDLLACLDRCIPARFELSTALDSAPSATEGERLRALFARSETRVPRAPDTLGLRVDARGTPLPDGALRVLLRTAGAAPGARALFYPDPEQGVALEAERGNSDDVASDDGQLVLELRGTQAQGEAPLHLAGVLVLHPPEGEASAVELSLPIVEGGELSSGPPTSPAAPPFFTGLRVLLFGFLGGLLLNLMPCVLPVLAIKVFAVVELAHKGRSEALRHAAAYTIGIELSLLALAAVVVALKMAGMQVGWGFQFQEPLFVLGLCVLIVLFALNLLGVFEIDAQGGRLAQLGANSSGTSRSFFDGLLAVALATPCTAPFLGTAVGFALSGSGATIALVFAAIGAGLALPFVAIAAVPGLARWLPKPGAWMVAFRELLGFALLATAVWLLFVLGRAQGLEALALGMAVLWILALGCWAYGRAQRAGRRRLGHAVAAVAMMLILGGSLALGTSRGTPSTKGSPWRAWEQAEVRTELERGRIVFVDFTADWCLTCKANERLVLGQPRVQQAFTRWQVALFKADWTRRDDAIGTELARFGRAGVPLYLVYHPSAPEEPTVLPELLTPDLVVQALEAPPTADASRVTAVTSSAAHLPIQ
jgi:thiol:disulfide interchange protein DsbD